MSKLFQMFYSSVNGFVKNQQLCALREVTVAVIFHVPLIPKTNLQSSHKSMNEHIIIYEQGVQLTSSVCYQKSRLKELRSLVFLFSPV